MISKAPAKILTDEQKEKVQAYLVQAILGKVDYHMTDNASVGVVTRAIEAILTLRKIP